MAHRHIVGLIFTGPDIEDGDAGHYHLVMDGQKTSIEKDGPKHTHTVGNMTTSGPLPMLGPGNPDQDEAKKKKKTKRKPKKTGWGY